MKIILLGTILTIGIQLFATELHMDDEQFKVFAHFHSNIAKKIDSIKIRMGSKQTTYINYYIKNKLVWQRITVENIIKNPEEMIKDMHMAAVIISIKKKNK